MTDTNQNQLGNTLRSIADQLRGAMDADDFRDYMLSFLFLRYLSENYETAAKKKPEMPLIGITSFLKNLGLPPLALQEIDRRYNFLFVEEGEI